MFNTIQSLLEKRMKKRGLSLNKSDVIDWIQELLPAGADDTLGRMLRTLTSQFWGSMFRLTRLDGDTAECEVWAAPRAQRSSVHGGVVTGAAMEIVVTLWQRNLLLNSAQVQCIGVEGSWSGPFPNGVYVRYQLTEEEVQRVSDQSRLKGAVRVDCPVKVCDQESCIVGEITVVCEVLVRQHELPAPERGQ